jgi:hypothetical protein
VSPTVLRSGAYRFFFFSSDGGEPPHVHAARERKTAKIWLEPVQLEHNDGFAQNELNKLLAVVRDHQAALLRAWHDFFGTGHGTGAGGKNSGH